MCYQPTRKHVQKAFIHKKTDTYLLTFVKHGARERKKPLKLERAQLHYCALYNFFPKILEGAT